jgi:tetratricopeptide (TPR) repeat protein
MRCEITAAECAEEAETAEKSVNAETQRRRGTQRCRRVPLCLCVSAFTIFSAVSAFSARSDSQPKAQQFGRIDFPTSGAPDAQPHFLRGVALLHNFEYDDAVEAFRRARELDPRFAMAYWGEALAHYSVLSGSSDVTGGREVLRQLAPTREARSARARTDKERGFIEAVDALFGDGDETARQRAYVAAMERLHARYSDDNEIASFYALALLDAAIRATYGLSARPAEGHGHASVESVKSVAQLAGSDTQRRAGEILRQVLGRNPEHPGAAHYLLHNYDDADHAARALDVARVYLRIAPESSHARHMPAHIFVQLGLWQEAAASDEAASRAAEAWAARRGLDQSRTDYHPLTWLQYERLQLGQFNRAREMAHSMQAAAVRTGSDLLKNHAASMRARYALEARRWDLLRDADDFGNLDELVAIGISAARGGNVERADQVRELFGRLASGGAAGPVGPALTVMEREVAALVHIGAGRGAEAIDALRAAAEAERALPTGMGPPRPIKPAQELLGEVLLETGRAAEARDAFEAALRRHPNRSASVLGLARAVAASGDRTLAGRHYATLLANWSEADGDRAELAEAREATEKGTVTLFRTFSWKKGTVLFVVVTALIAIWSLRRRRRAPEVTGRRPEARATRSRKRSGR